jgi:hypothetical protein
MDNVHIEVDDSLVLGVVEALQLKLQPSELKVWLTTHAHRELRERAEERFANEGDDAVGKWAELTRATGIVRQYLGYSPFHPINVRSGALKNLVLNTFTVKDRGASGASLSMPGPASGEMLSKLRVAQQGGFGTGGTTRAGFGRGSARSSSGGEWGNIRTGPNRPAPPRPVLALSQRDSLVLSHSLLDWIRQGIF